VSERFPVITGLGVIAAPGCGMDEIWPVIAAGQSGLRPLTLFQSPRYGQIPVGEVTHDLTALGAPLHGSRSDKLAWLAARDAIRDANLDPKAGAERTGVLLGSSVGGTYDTERFLTALIKQRKMLARPTRFHECSSPVDLVADSFGLFGPSFAISTACSSGALAIATAAELIQSGQADVMLAGGTDSLSHTTWAGFHSLLLVDPQGCRPFDATRGGMSFGEGAAVVIIEAEEHARKRGAKILARLTGWGASCDAHHVTAPHPEGAGAVAAMQSALRRAQLSPDVIGYINAHGTGTRDNDVAESKALKTLFGTNIPPFSSTKRFFGHSLAASGAIEAIVCIEALRRQQLPANPGFSELDPAVGLTPVTETRAAKLTHVMSNSFGFGGNNAVLIFSTPETVPQTRATPTTPAIVTGLGLIVPEKNSISDRAIQPPLPPDSVKVHACGPLADAATLTPNQRRRLSRITQMAILAARRSHTADPAKRLAVALGTGFGCLDEGAVFIENLVAKDEAEPMPTRFPGSVHNAPSGQVAIDLGATGLNSAPTMGEISFESALWQAMNQLATGEADEALAGAVDELNKYALTIGKRWGFWNDQTIPGEAAMVANLASSTTSKTPLARVTAVRLGRYDRPFAATLEAEWIAQAIDLTQIRTVVTGGKGWPALDALYDGVVVALSRRAGRTLVQQTYKQHCGEFYSASALGFVKAIELAREQQRPVLLYTLSLRGAKALCCVAP
jgi:3-oxoacyl-(acyl-carrier-protein) synthase